MWNSPKLTKTFLKSIITKTKEQKIHIFIQIKSINPRNTTIDKWTKRLVMNLSINWNQIERLLNLHDGYLSALRQSIFINWKINFVTAVIQTSKTIFCVYFVIDTPHTNIDWLSWTVSLLRILRSPPLKCHLIGKLIGRGTLLIL